MHTDLSPHLHTLECNDLIRKFQECHKEQGVFKIFGGCNEIATLVENCLQKERVANATANRVRAKERRAKLKESLAGADNNN